MKAIDVNGFRYHDIVLYLASLLAALGENVFVRDMTEDLSMSRYLPEIDGVGEGAMLEFKGVGFAQGQMPVPEDCTFCFNLWEPARSLSVVREDNVSDFRLFITDEEPMHEKDMDYSLRFSALGTCGYDESDAFLVIRDYVGMVMQSLIGMFAGNAKNRVFRLPYSEKDRKAELYLTARNDNTFRNISDRMSCLLEELVARLRPGTACGEFERAYRTALRGGSR
ncbi:MAG: hypothetical protein K6F16_10620 [Lachnospiraceae bacterium]|nr:hypothetical protein [Lachnospiraceae bacterium]